MDRLQGNGEEQVDIYGRLQGNQNSSGLQCEVAY